MERNPLILIYEKSGLNRLVVIKKDAKEENEIEVIKIVENYNSGYFCKELLHFNGIWSLDGNGNLKYLRI